LKRRIEYRQSGRKFWTFFPDKGPFRRELYPKHIEFFALGREFNERAIVAGNRVGKTIAGAYEMTCHLTGLYPDWWQGKVFDRPVNAWAAGDTTHTVKEILQAKLLGPPGDAAALGSGMIPRELITSTTLREGVRDAISSVVVRHRTGRLSRLLLKSYDQRREAFQGTEQDVIWLDEESPEDIYTECLLRTTTTGGIVYLTFTPLMGLTPLVLSFLPELQVSA
jgi:phage terminase large subunit-like protein